MSKKSKKMILFVLFVVFAILIVGCEGPMGPQGDPGVDGVDGIDGEDGADGEDGNANVTEYIFEGHDFSSDPDVSFSLTDLGITEQERKESAWLVYLFYNGYVGGVLSYQVPGFGAHGEEYSVEPTTIVTPGYPQILTISLVSGTGDYYYEIRVIQIQANEVIDTRSMSVSSESLIPEFIDTSDYEAVSEYYGLD